MSASPSDGTDSIVGWERTILPPGSSHSSQRPVYDDFACSNPCIFVVSHVKVHFCGIVLCLQWSWWGWPGTRFSFTFEFYLWLHKRIISTHGFSLSLAKMCIPVHHGQGGPVSEIASLPLSEEPSPGPFNFQSRCERGFTDIALICET